jgi:LPXTG-motif cell wall-anchored protein
MKFLKVLSTSAIAAAILASMSATAYAENINDDDDIPGVEESAIPAENSENPFALEKNPDDDNEEEPGDEEENEESNLPAANEASATGVGEDNDTADPDTEANETETEDGTTAEADFNAGKKKSIWDEETWDCGTGVSPWAFQYDEWSTEFTPAGVPATATLFDVVQCAIDCGVNDLNVQSLSNFLMLNEDEFTSDDYVAFIAAALACKEAIMDDHCAALFPGKTLGQLSQEDRRTLYNDLNRDEKDAIASAIINVANAHRVLVSFDTDADGYPLLYASMRQRIAAPENTQVAAGSAVAATGGELPETGSAGAAAFAGIALAVAGLGAVLVARKNRA